jgi:hypothetical protein
MTRVELRASLRRWRWRLEHRRKKHRYWHNGPIKGTTEARRKELAAKWHGLVEEAEKMVNLRKRQLDKAVAGDYPRDLPVKYRYAWDHPWKQRPRLNIGFRRWLDNHGYLTPHFTKEDARCNCGTWVPSHLLTRARNHAFNLEQLRHELGDKPIPILSWYRPDWYNRQIGGASQSKHIEAIATDMTREWVARVGRDNFNRAADKVFRDGGVGRYPAGSVHVDTRGFRARWTTF